MARRNSPGASRRYYVAQFGICVSVTRAEVRNLLLSIISGEGYDLTAVGRPVTIHGLGRDESVPRAPPARVAGRLLRPVDMDAEQVREVLEELDRTGEIWG
jgi:hypothetical protein